ncbi:MAG TPA: hypothetical protein VMH87_20090 [Pseudomonadales bacterium]|nr:hypothetical protein [Pseudomonadales bacterium]
MEWLYCIAYFFGGMFFTNAIPHLVSGLMGRPFQSPFAKPPGRGLSSATVNVLWGFANLLIGYCLVFHVGNFNLRALPDAIALGLGILGMSLICAQIFGAINGGNSPKSLSQD